MGDTHKKRHQKKKIDTKKKLVGIKKRNMQGRKEGEGRKGKEGEGRKGKEGEGRGRKGKEGEGEGRKGKEGRKEGRKEDALSVNSSILYSKFLEASKEGRRKIGRHPLQRQPQHLAGGAAPSPPTF